MESCYLLQWYVNAYDQEGAVTLGVFKNKPDFHALKKYITENEIEIDTYLEGDSVYGKLARGGISEFASGGGHLYCIEKISLN